MVFWEAHHLKVSTILHEIRQREYATSLGGLKPFKNQLFKAFAQVVKQMPCQTVVMGDRASWIWRMADEEYADALQILDFFHACEYAWEVARPLYPEQQDAPKAWVAPQFKRFKESKWQ